MSTGVTVYKSTDTSAPAVNSSLGSLITLLDAILVNGYGSKAAAGWTKPYTGTNKASYQMGGGNQFYLDVDDNGPGAGLGKEARMRGYETMSAVATGTGLFPTVAQLAAGIIVRKSAEASGGTTARVWKAVADDRTLYLFINAGDSLGYTGFMFGDFYSVLANDSYRTAIIGRQTENNATATPENMDKLSVNGTSMAGHYIARSYTGTGTSIVAVKHGDVVLNGGGNYMSGNYPFPNPADGSFIGCPVYMQQGIIGGSPAGSRRGKLRGLLQGGHLFSTNFADGDTLAVSTTKTYELIGRGYTNADSFYVVETSDTWDTNT